VDRAVPPTHCSLFVTRSLDEVGESGVNSIYEPPLFLLVASWEGVPKDQAIRIPRRSIRASVPVFDFGQFRADVLPAPDDRSSIGVSQPPSCLARAYAELGKFDDAWRCIGEAMTTVETAQERLWQAKIHRVAGEIAGARAGRGESASVFRACTRGCAWAAGCPGNCARR
jgi:hypothetical protein